jgi:RNA polymerase sigma factor for flagellar operon FliA
VSADEREAAIRALFPLVRRIASRVARLVPAADPDDLVGDGALGAIRAIDTFDPARGPLEVYARRLISGAMLNGLRRVDPVSERVRRTMREAEARRHALAHELGRLPSLAELERNDPVLRKARLAVYQRAPLSLDAPGGDLLTPAAGGEDPLRAALHADDRRSIASGLARLSPRQRAVVTLHYFGELSLHAIGRRLAISPQRASQLHATALQRLRAYVPAP